MSIFRNDTLGSMTRGGQAIVHNLRMTMQVIRQTGIACLIVWVMLTGWALLEWVPAYTQYLLKRIGEAWFQVYVVGSPSSAIQFMTPAGFRYWTRADAILQSNAARKALAEGQEYLLFYGSGAALIAFGIMLSVWYYFTKSGRHIGSNQFLRGASFAKARELRRRLRRLPKGCLKVGGIQIPAAYEPEHLLLSGAPGTGKTNILHVMLEGIRKEGKRAIVYDTAGSFVERFYRPGKDIILNPFDSRSSQWAPWMDAPIDYHYDQIAESVVPDSGKDPFWAKSARGTLVAVMRGLKEQNRMLISVMLDVITRSGLKSLAEFVEGSDGAAFISQEGERTSAGIQAELASVLRGFRYLDDTRAGLSIRRWVTNEDDDGWLFITVKADQLPTLRPLITMWLDIAINAIMSMTPDQQRRLYCVIDELPSLQRLPSLSDFLARARKYGGCGILGFQSYPQLEATYGRQEAAALTGYCSTWVALRANDEPTARHISSNLGQVEQVEANEGMSYGVNDMRDGVSLSRTQVTRPLVLPTEIVNLPNLTGYLRFGRDLPVIRFTDRYHPAKADQPAYVDRTEPAVRLDPIASETIDPTAASAPDDADSPDATNGRHRPTDIRLIGQRSGADGGAIWQQSRPNGPFRPADPA
ncbi:type IV secretion system DNA-binding domain-containing protein [Sphingobium sp. SA916]|uniref:type IV secretion system DNA-binding domain-containing protein n=1 Tax=Sphingobium sp. SA916 TaxID=1851207 RepID=UPI000C9F9E1D|nr:type IV secretion system DNA-binding domain-containing protein [Sphingobium sp. SA916]PNQ01990.1 conjugal transfer protein TraD [Sphingobium sp. SA916]